jgi:3-hydroxybutyryl-CoA dehydratase
MQIGDKFNAEFLVNDEVYNGFINLFKDQNPLHTNKNFANEKGFDNKVMHGNILNGFLSFFIGECLPIKNVIIQRQEIKFIQPVFLNSKINLIAEIADIFESVNTIEFKYFFQNELNKKVASGKIQIGILK